MCSSGKKVFVLSLTLLSFGMGMMLECVRAGDGLNTGETKDWAKPKSTGEQKLNASNQAEESKILQFYAGYGVDQSKRTLFDILSFSRDSAERSHDYIQWLFPTRFKNSVNPAAPSLNPGDVVVFSNRPELRQNYLKSFDYMLKFYGLKSVRSEGALRIIQADDFSECGKHWLFKGNHNYARIARILISLNELGFTQEANALFNTLEKDVYPSHKKEIGSKVLEVWRQAREGRLAKPSVKEKPQSQSQAITSE